jgi:lysophospholipase L1-like esterase
MSARGRFLSGLVTVVIALAGFVTVGALPAAATDSRTVQYVALGDSYAAGTAVGSFPNCPHSPIGYPALLDSEERIHLRANEACSGATTDEVADSQLSALNRGTRLVTLTVGGADLELSAVLTACTTGTQFDCLAAIDAASGGLKQLRIDLTNLYVEVADAAPRARIVVTGYPHLFEPVNPLFMAINDAIDQLNATIAAAVLAADPPGDGDKIFYVDVVGAFEGHGIGCQCTDPFIHNLVDENNQPDPEAFHPTADGYRAYADAISVVLPPEWLDEQAQLV